MRIYALSPLDSKLQTWSRRLKIPLAYSPNTLNKIIAITDGHPDDTVMLILTHKLDGEKVVGALKTRFTMIGGIKSILKIMPEQFKQIEAILFTLDQNTKDLSELWEEIVDTFKQNSTLLEMLTLDGSNRVRVFKCRVVREFSALVVINGLNYDYTRHTIEDHLIEALKNVDEESVKNALNSSRNDPKAAWRNLTRNEEFYREIFKRLLNMSIGELKRIFPQHILSLQHFMKI